MSSFLWHALPAPDHPTLFAAVVLAVAAALVPVTAAPAAEEPGIYIREVASQGYWLVAADGAAYAFGDAALAGANRNQGPDIVGMARTPDGDGYWMVDEDGDVFHYGKAASLGSRSYNADDVVGFAGGPRGTGYWMVAADGGVFAFGEAGFFGSTGALRLNRPIVGMAATPSGDGYWLVASDGGIFAFGEAAFHGSTGAIRLNRSIVGMASTGTGRGYWLAASDGGIFNFGDATFHGSTGAMALPQPIIGVVATAADQEPLAVPGESTLDEDTSGAVTVIGRNNAPVVTDLSLTTDEGVPVTGQVTATDADGDVLTFTVSAPAGHGTVTLEVAGAFVYTPDAGYTGSDAFVIDASDGQGGTASSAVGVSILSILPLDDQPVAVADAAAGTEDLLVVVDVAANDTGLSDGGVMVSVDAATLDPFTEGTATVAGGTVTLLPASNAHGAVTFDYTISDADGDTATATVTVTLTPVNDAPTVSAIEDVTVPFGTRDSASIAFTVGDVDTALGSLTVIATSSNPALVPDSGLSLNQGPSLGQWTLSVSPLHRQEGTSTITVTVSDGTAGAVATFTFTVLAR